MRRLILVTVFSCASLTAVLAQQPPSSAGAQKTLAATLEVYVFPTVGQPPEQQSKDEAQCYQWAVQNTGTDPFAAQKQAAAAQQQAAQQQQNVQQATQGAGVKGAVGGAAAGALIGEIASNDADKGAAYGAAAGAIVARRRAKHAQAEAQQQGQQQVQQAQALSKEQIDGFRKAFSVCLEAKKYMVKF
jgi:hypothetical protein